MEIIAKDIRKGNLILVNCDHPLYQDDQSDLVYCNEKVRIKSIVYQLIENIKEKLQMQDDVVYVSGFRSFAYQKKLYDDTLAKHGSEYTQKFVAKEGCSEHNTGLAIDLGEKLANIDYICPYLPYDGKFAQFRKELLAHGFIERYLETKQEITKIAKEPWHFRYVGYPHSLIMAENDWCLEEYHQQLLKYDHQHPLCYRQCQIFYLPKGERVSVDANCYQISGNNSDGCIVTLFMVDGDE
ncbi:MAG: D-alanyl-D-alanine carboxypeptidase family protein [Erysipelotrichaceae bacterium]|nr:D-alanyl-D-alanine carboxypeptidase family protein [Erysipelotrichaceae bacterium]MDY5252649.1 D-alanyl-D-alanine carboxypeptidase family protein [Erysipelotrichaceae bacterium]